MPQSKINKVQEDIEEGDRFHFRSTDEDDLLVGSKKRIRSKDDIGMEIQESANKVKKLQPPISFKDKLLGCSGSPPTQSSKDDVDLAEVIDDPCLFC